MAKRVEGMTDRLLKAAREEFLEKGYERASLRDIAARATSSKGAIYVRYSDKEALLDAVVGPALDGLCDLLENTLGTYVDLPAKEKRASRDAYADQGIEAMVDYLYDHFSEFKIVVDMGGAKFEGLLHRLIELELATSYDYLKTAGGPAPMRASVEPELLHIIVSGYFSGIFQVIAHDLSRDKAKACVASLSSFYRAGWAVLFEGPDSEGPLT